MNDPLDALVWKAARRGVADEIRAERQAAQREPTLADLLKALDLPAGLESGPDLADLLKALERPR